MENIGAVIIARLGSSRLPRKHLLKINDKTIIEWIILRILNTTISNNIIIATSLNPENREFEFLKDKYDIKIFYGSNGNIPLRLLECANFYNLDKMICISGDNPLTSIDGIEKVKMELKNNNYVETIGLPLGMNLFGFTTDILIKSMNNKYKQMDDLEFLWTKIFKSKKFIKLGNYDIFNKKLRFTLDYYEDYLFFKALIEYLDYGIFKLSDKEIIETTLLKGFNNINNTLYDIYLKNFNKGIRKTHNIEYNAEDVFNNKFK